MKILVTGAAGFIGSHLSSRLLQDGHEVLGLDSFDPYYNPALKEQHVAQLGAFPGFKLQRGDIRDASLVSEVIEQFAPERIVHLAARAGVRPSIADPATYAEVNVTGTTHILEAAARAHIPVVFASSSSVYGDAAPPPYREDDAATHPVSPYAATKRAGELLAYTYHHLHGLPVTCLRFFTVYGPRQRPDMAIHKFAKAILKGDTITLFGDGSTARDYTFIGDIVNGVTAATLRAPELGYAIFNLGSGRTIELKQLVELLEKITGKNATIEWQGDQPGDVKLTYADITEARAKLDYEPHTTMEEGLRATVEWLQKEI